jgi:colicin import membrane protein
MSIMDRARTYAGVTLEQGKSTLVTASGRFRALPGDTRDLARGAITLARRQAYATMGASDAIVATITRQQQELPLQAKENAVKLVETTKARVDVAADLAAKAQEKIASAAGELTERSVGVAASVRKITPAATAARVKDAAEGRAGQAKDAYAKLTVRGEQVATDLRHDPVLVRIIRDADTRVEKAANGVTSVAQKVRASASAQAKRESAATSPTPVRVTPATKVPTHRSTVRKTTPAEAPVLTSPTHRSAAYETATRKAAAKKAAATRQAAAEEAAAKREAAAKKAAATRRKTAAAHDQAAEAHRSAAVKAAATRKRNATDD